MECSIIVLSFDKPRHLDITLKSIEKFLLSPKKSRELIVVDNNSSDRNVGIVLDSYEKKGHEIIRNDTNLMFSAGMNIGIEYAVGEFVLLCNDDIEFVSDALTQMITYIKENSNVGTLTPLTLRRNGMVYCSGAYGHGTHCTDIIKQPRETEWNNMAVFLTRENYFHTLGMLETDEPYRHYSSDEEWGRRMTAEFPNLKHVVHPAIVYHYYREKE